MYQFMRRVVGRYRGFVRPAVVMMVLLAFGQLLGLARPALFGKMGDTLFAAVSGNMDPPAAMAYVRWLIALVGGSYVLAFVFRGIREIVEVKYLEYDMEGETDQRTLERLMQFSPGQHMGGNSGVRMKVISRGQHSLNALAFTMLFDALPLMMRLTAMLVMLLWLDWRIGAIILVGVLSHFGVSALMNRFLVPKVMDLEKRSHRYARLYGEVVRYMPLVQYNVQEQRMLRECEREGGEVYGFAKAVWAAHCARVIFRNSFIIGGTTIALLWVGTEAVFQGRLTPGVFTTTVLWWSISVLEQIETFGVIQRRILVMRAAIQKYFDMLDMEPAVVQDSNPVVLEQVRGRVEFLGVSFAYPKRKASARDDDAEDIPRRLEPQESLIDVSFTVEPGEMVAIVGPSGAGKSTLAKLLLRSYDVDGGAILVDGVDIRCLTLKQLRGSIGYVQQDVELWDESLGYNIAYCVEDWKQVPDAEMHRVAELSRVAEFSDRMEQRFSTRIGERGVQLSGGQRQRVGIGRAIMREPAILILDEATSNLDAGTERDIAQAMEEVSRGRTTIVIAHRFSTIRRAQKVVVMDQGRVADIGTHDELDERCPVYHELMKEQRF